MNKNGIIYTVIFTFLVAFFFVFFLSLADGATKELVQKNNLVSVQKSVLKALDILPSDSGDIASTYEKLFETVPQAGDRLKTVKEGTEVLIGYFSGSGLWGTITGIIAVDGALDRIVGLDIISHNETPGLGGRIDEEWFKEQFKGEKIGADGIKVAKGSGSADTDSNNSIVDGITGASLTSKSMETIVNKELNLFRTERSSK
ncbi:FMN-binding protein [Oceanispirochaeta sp.]|jgi:Na+-transporting NADH:ubiquinone oxidoreductase subunit C|uniref:FMN-binding protein n=1 Tax=Oceanispirochaeta sp. TaxID=2035350 RepID=UPI00261BD7AB|nr:FMN-binding protein [Oceanispirochaeta sp.]MDA3955870.1 FMN-binding protein [Oceanispirochaeta sp.]